MEGIIELCAGRVRAGTGSITDERVDAIVNAANSGLLGGGGVDGAIHAAGGLAVTDACRALRRTEYPDGLPTGQAVATTAGNLQARYVIHTAGPVWRGGEDGEDELLAAAYTNSLELAESLGCSSIAFPAISTGAYGFPPERAARIVQRVLETFFATRPRTLDDVRLVFWKSEHLARFRAGMGDA